MKLADKLQAANQLGWDQVLYNLYYRLNIRLGTYKLSGTKALSKDTTLNLALFDPASPDDIRQVIGEKGAASLLAKADRIVEGNFQRFGDLWVSIDLTPATAETHWSDIERSPSAFFGDIDIKEIWEPARFGWAIILARAYALSGEKKYLDQFIAKFYEFIEHNPVDHGPNWLSGQEVGIRLMSMVLAARLFEPGLPAGSNETLARSIHAHAERVIKTLAYARSQNNNHYLTESIALLTASKTLPNLRRARTWRAKALKGIRWCLNNQFHDNGEYVQHSTNYHRLMTQSLVWAAVIEPELLTWPEMAQFSKATEWYADRLDPQSGGVPNLGANDGALLFPLDELPFQDHRGALAQARAALGYTDQRQGGWDEGALWLSPRPSNIQKNVSKDPSIIQNGRSWGSLRIIEHHDRPSHADHLHFDLWWKGYNLLIDPGTYSYNLPAPWDNTLTSADHHNTITVDGMDQMRKVSKFLYLDWGNSWITDHAEDTLTAEIDVWKIVGTQHEREIRVISSSEWVIIDTLTCDAPDPQATAELHWHFPDLPWTIMEDDRATVLRLRAPVGRPTIELSCDSSPTSLKLVRAGELLHGNGTCNETDGWSSPTYLRKDPALSLTFSAPLARKTTFKTRVRLDEV